MSANGFYHSSCSRIGKKSKRGEEEEEKEEVGKPHSDDRNADESGQFVKSTTKQSVETRSTHIYTVGYFLEIYRTGLCTAICFRFRVYIEKQLKRLSRAGLYFEIRACTLSWLRNLLIEALDNASSWGDSQIWTHRGTDGVAVQFSTRMFSLSLSYTLSFARYTHVYEAEHPREAFRNEIFRHVERTKRKSFYSPRVLANNCVCGTCSQWKSFFASIYHQTHICELISEIANGKSV